MATEEVYLGTWRIVECVFLAGPVETTGIEGTEFTLDEGGDVSWKVSEDAEQLPFFNCETYEVVPDKDSPPKSINFIGTYAGLEVNFKVDVSDDLMLLTYERCCMLQCQKVSSPDPKDDVPFSFLGALEEGYFTDIVIAADSGKEYKAHSTILSLTACHIDWTRSPTPLTGLSEDVVETTLHYLYAECLPRGMSEDTARSCIRTMSKIPELTNFVKLCETFLKNTALKQQITNLVTDMHTCADRIIELFSGVSAGEDAPPQTTDSSIITNPARLCYVVKQALREGAVALSKLMVLCDLFSRRKSELSREERHDIIKYAKTRIPVFMRQLEKFLEVCKQHTVSMSVDQRQEIAMYLVPEIESSMDLVTGFVSDSKAALEQVISGSEKEKTEKAEKSEKGKKGHVGDILGKTLKNALHVRELKKLKKLHDRSTTTFFHFMQRKDMFVQTSRAEKVSTISRLLEQLVDEIPILLMKIQELMSAIDVKLTWRDWKYIFKLGTSKISWGLCKLQSNKHTIQTLIQQACDMVHRDPFSASITSLGLLRTGADNSASASVSVGANASQKQKTKYVQLSSVESLCIPPYARDSVLAKQTLKLLQRQRQTDMIFEIVLAHDIGDTVIDHTSGEAVVRTESERDVEVYQIPVHRVVIAARCDWFRRALLSGMRESIDRKITVHDTNPELFRLFLEYLYSGQLEMNELSTEQLTEMMTLADRYDTTSLKSCCEHTLKHHVDDETVLYLLSLADQLNAKTLKEVCMNYVCDRPVLVSSEVFHDLPETLQIEVESLSLTALEAHPRNFSGHSHTETPSSVSSVSEIDEMVANVELADRMNPELGASSSTEELAPLADSRRLEACLVTLRDIVGDTVPHDELVRIALAADYDVNRALNFVFA